VPSTAELLCFEEATHTYRYDGRKVPSVTQVLGILSDFSAVDPQKLERARSFGVNLHRAIDLDNRGELDEEQLDAQLRPYLQQWHAFLNVTGFVVTASEQRVYHPIFGYAGCADVVGVWQNTSWVLDVKSGWIPRSVGAQLAAYQQALNPRPRKRLCLQLKPDGYRLQECLNLGDFSLFQSCLNVWRFCNAD
jgi:hypothetical protein